MTSPQKKKMRDKIKSLYFHLKVIYCVLILNVVVYGVGVWLCYNALRVGRTVVDGPCVGPQRNTSGLTDDLDSVLDVHSRNRRGFPNGISQGTKVSVI